MMSCITPKGQITEQYVLPKMSVTAMSMATTTKFSASAAGRNWIFAIQPSHACNAPVTSRNSRVVPVKNIAAKIILNILNIVSSFYVC